MDKVKAWFENRIKNRKGNKTKGWLKSWVNNKN